MQKTIIILAAVTLAAAAMAGFAGQAALAQYSAQSSPQGSDRKNDPSDRYDEGYRAGYRAGYDAARNTQRYDDRPELTAESRGAPGAGIGGL